MSNLPQQKPMTKHQAWREAEKRWATRGPYGAYPQVCLRTKKHANRCLVGYCLRKDPQGLKVDPLLIGEGPTWEEAFANAAEREAQGLPPIREGFL